VARGVTLTPHPLLVPWSRKVRAIPQPPPPRGAVRPVQSLSACTRVHFTFFYVFILLLLPYCLFLCLAFHFCVFLFFCTYVFVLALNNNNSLEVLCETDSRINFMFSKFYTLWCPGNQPYFWRWKRVNYKNFFPYCPRD
jgi:hypothetical protein